jgi:hypothetical protein
VVGRCFSILSDIEKRKLYDETGGWLIISVSRFSYPHLILFHLLTWHLAGSLDDDDMEANTNDKDWASVWRGMFKEVTKKDIEEYLRKFRGKI